MPAPSSPGGKEQRRRKSELWKARESGWQIRRRPSEKRWSLPWARQPRRKRFACTQPTVTHSLRTKRQIMKTLERTLTIIKPDAVKKNAIGDIIEQFEKQGFRILS